MKEKNLPEDINSKSLNDLTELAQNIIHKLESEKNLENSINDYQKLIKLNSFKIPCNFIRKTNQFFNFLFI